jgi:hypothetical protein
MVISEFESSVAALVVETEDAQVTAVGRAEGVVAAMEAPGPFRHQSNREEG